MAVPKQLLIDLAGGLQVVPTGPAQFQPGQRVQFKLIPPASELRVTDLLAGALDLTFITKDVRFVKSTVESSLEPGTLNPQILGGIPLEGLDPLPGVPGTLGQLRGTVPIPVEVPVRLEVRWTVLDAQDNELPAGTAFVAPDGLESAEVSFIFAPEVVELTNVAPPAPIRRSVRASVRLSAGGAETDFINLPKLPVFVPALPVPTVLALFVHANFQPRDRDDDGAVLVVVPASSPLRLLGELQSALDALEAAVSALSSFAGFASFLPGIRDLAAALPPQPHIQFRATDGIGDLNSITLIQRGLFENDTEAEDELSSLILIGPADRKARFFNARGFKAEEGQFELTLGPELFAIVRTLHVPEPISEPNGDEIVIGTASTQRDRFGDELSSLHFL